MSGTKLMQHPRVGTLELDFEMLSMPDDSGQRLLTYTAAADSETAYRLRSLQPAFPAPDDVSDAAELLHETEDQ